MLIKLEDYAVDSSKVIGIKQFSQGNISHGIKIHLIGGTILERTYHYYEDRDNDYDKIVKSIKKSQRKVKQ